MEPTTDNATLTADERRELLEQLTPETLSALMRSNWTWDDRALRRQMSGLLVALAAVRELRAGDVACTPSIIEAAESRALAEAGEFIAEVLGPRLLADTGNAFRGPLLHLVTATAGLAAEYGRSLDTLALDVTGQVIERNEGLAAVLAEADWETKAFDSAIGLARVAYSAGYTLSKKDYFAAAGLGAQAFRIAGSPNDKSVDVRHSTLAAAEQTGSWDPALVRTRAAKAGDGWVISGEKWFVPGADAADTIFVIARTPGGPSLYRIEGTAPGIEIETSTSLDKLRPLARVTFDKTPAILIGREGTGGRIMNRTVDTATTVLAGEEMGLVDRALRDISQVPPSCSDSDSWGPYTRELAELELLRASATALWYRAVRIQCGDDLDAYSVAAAMAHIGCSNAIRHIALRLRSVTNALDPETVAEIRTRARTTDLLFGGPALAHERLLDRIGI
jgi:hypothetical protein